MYGLQLASKRVDRVTGRREQITVEPHEIAVYLLFRNYPLNEIYCGSMTLCGEPDLLNPVIAFQIVVTIVKRGYQMRRCAGGHPAADLVGIEHDDRCAGARQHISGCHSGDPGTYDADIRFGICN